MAKKRTKYREVLLDKPLCTLRIYFSWVYKKDLVKAIKEIKTAHPGWKFVNDYPIKKGDVYA